MRCPRPLGACSRVCALGVLCVGCPWPHGSCSPMCALGFVVSAVSFTTWRLFTGACTSCRVRAASAASWPLCTSVNAWCVVCAVSFGPFSLVHRCLLGVWYIRCPWRLGACSPVCAPGALRWQRPWPLGSHSPVCILVVCLPVFLVPLPLCVCGLCVVRWAAACWDFLWPLWFLCTPGVLRALRAFGVLSVPRVGCGSLAPGPVPWLWPAACLTGVPRGPAFCATPRPVRSPLVGRSAFSSPWCLPLPGDCAPGFTLRLCGAHEGK